MNNDQNEKEKIVSDTIIDEILNDLEEKTLSNISPKLIKKTLFFEIKSMSWTLLGWLISLLSLFFILNILYLSYNENSIENASLKMIETLDTFTIIKNYLSIGIASVIAFATIACVSAYISKKVEKNNYEKNRKRLLEFRNVVYIVFIVSFCLKSFTVDQLNLVTLMISLVLLFKFVFNTDNTVSEKELKSIINKKNIDMWNQEIKKEEKKANTIKKKNLVKQTNRKESYFKPDTLHYNFLIVIYFFYGFILLFFGDKIQIFYKNMTDLQTSGLSLIVAGFILYSLVLTLLERKKSLLNRSIDVLVSITLFIGANSILGNKLNLPLALEHFFIYFIPLSILLISARVTSNLFIMIKKLNTSITDPTQKLTLLIGFFGIIISLLTILN